MIQRILSEKNDPLDRTAFAHLLVAALTRVAGVSKADQDRLLGAWHRGGWDVVFQIEGVDVDLKAIMAEWEKQLDRMVGDEAAKLVRERTSGLFESVELVVADARREILRRIEDKLGIKLREED